MNTTVLITPVEDMPARARAAIYTATAAMAGASAYLIGVAAALLELGEPFRF